MMVKRDLTTKDSKDSKKTEGFLSLKKVFIRAHSRYSLITLKALPSSTFESFESFAVKS
jgi:hypothetical protein